MRTKMCLFRPLAKLYTKINEELTKDEERKILNLLVGKQLNRKESQELNNVTEIFLCLETKGFISEDDLTLVKDIITAINRCPLLKYVSECESELEERKKLPSSVDEQSRNESYQMPTERESRKVRHKERGRQKRLKCYKILFWITGAVSVSVAIITISIFRGAYGCPLQNTGQRVWLALLTTTYMSAVVCMVILLLCAAERISCEVLRNKEVTSTIVSLITTIVAGTIFVAMLTGDCFTVQEKTNPYTSTSPFPSLSSTGLNETS